MVIATSPFIEVLKKDFMIPPYILFRFDLNGGQQSNPEANGLLLVHVSLRPQELFVCLKWPVFRHAPDGFWHRFGGPLLSRSRKKWMNLLVSLILSLQAAVPMTATASPICINLLQFDSAQEVHDSFSEYKDSKKILERWINRKKYFSALERYLENGDDPELVGGANPQFWTLIRETITDQREPTAEELEFLRSKPHLREVYRFTLFAADANRTLAYVLKAVTNYFQPQAEIVHFPYEKTYALKVLRALGGLYRLVQWASPVPLPDLKTPTGSIFKKQWQDPSYAPTTTEVEVLKKYKALETFEEKKDFMSQHPKWTTFRKWIQKGAKAFVTVNLILALNQSLHMSGGMVDVNTYLNDPGMRPQDSQVQLIVDVVPFPHMAIRNGDKIYSYGVSHMTVRPVTTYMRADEINKIYAEQFKETDTRGPIKRIIGKLVDLPRSAQVITLNLTPQERHRLKRDLEMSTGMHYHNNTMVNDCATMVFRALRKDTSVSVSPLIDSFPSEIAMYFSMLKSAGSSQVGPIYQVAIGRSEAPVYHLIRNTYINMIEAKMMVAMIPYNEVSRIWMEVVYGSEGFQYRDPLVQVEINSWRDDVRSYMESKAQIQTFRMKVARFAREGTQASRAELAGVIQDYFQGQLLEARQIVSQPDTDFKDVILNQYRIELLEQERAQLLRTLAPTNFQ